MNITNEITRLQSARNTIREKLTGFGLAENSANLSDCAEAITHIENNGAVNAEIKDGGTFIIPAGYHNGQGTITANNGYDEFWDAYQQNGTRTYYNYLFAGSGWNATTFNPKYSMYPIRADCMFHTCAIHEDLQEIFERQGIVLDTSNATSFGQMFAYSSITRVGELNTLKSSSSLSMMFYNASYLKTIDKLILQSNGSQEFSNTFYNAKELENITIEGTIGNDFDITFSSKLTKDSISSILKALSTTTSGKKIKLSQDAVINAFGSINDDEFRTLLNKRPNWSLLLSGTTTV